MNKHKIHPLEDVQHEKELAIFIWNMHTNLLQKV